MAAKMNWDRVRKESQSRRSGIDWIGQDSTGPKLDPPHKQVPTKSKSFKKFVPSRKIINGCTCKKTLGFKGEHKHSCPLKGLSNPTLEQFAGTVRKVDQRGLLASSLVSLRKDVDSNTKVSEQDRQESHGLIQFLLDRLILKQPTPPERNNRMNVFNPAALAKLLQLHIHFYLRGENGEAVGALQLAAKELKLTVYRFACSPRTKGTEVFSTALRGVFANGGILCFESLEKASSDFQFCLKGWLNDALLESSSGAKKHRDFTIVLTSPTPARQLWSGQIDPALLDSLAYLDMTSGGPSAIA